MPSPFFMILGISSTLLGLYITIVSVIHPDSQVDYHIGCYLSADSATHSLDLRSRLQRVKLKDDYNRKLNSLIKTNPIVDDNLHPKSLIIANNVKSYIQSLQTTNNYHQANIQYFTQISQVRKQYTQCASQLANIINIDENKLLWQNYKQCFTRYETQKAQIDKLYLNRKSLLQSIDSLMRHDTNPNKDFDLEQQLRKIKLKYDQQNALNDKNKQSYLNQLKILQQKNQVKSAQLDQNQRQYNRTKIQYEICLKNLKQFRKCQDIAKALREYGYVETVQSLQDRIKSKREILVKLRQHVLQNRQGGGNQVITEMYAKREKELIQTIKLRLQMGYDEMKQCGCTQTQRNKLQKQFQDSKVKLNFAKKQVNDILTEIFSYERNIKQTDKIREKLINQFREDTQKLKNKQNTNILTLQQKLAVLKQQLQQINDKLSTYSSKISSIQFQCNQYKDRLGSKLGDGQKVTDCMANKMLFDGLREKASLIVREQESGLSDGRDKLVTSLQSISYPQRLVIGSLGLVDWEEDTSQKVNRRLAQNPEQESPEQEILEEQQNVEQSQQLETAQIEALQEDEPMQIQEQMQDLEQQNVEQEEEEYYEELIEDRTLQGQQEYDEFLEM